MPTSCRFSIMMPMRKTSAFGTPSSMRLATRTFANSVRSRTSTKVPIAATTTSLLRMRIRSPSPTAAGRPADELAGPERGEPLRVALVAPTALDDEAAPQSAVHRPVQDVAAVLLGNRQLTGARRGAPGLPRDLSAPLRHLR